MTVPLSKVAVGPAGETEVVRLTSPAKPCRLVRVTVEVPRLPRGITKEEGLAVIPKSWTLTVTVVEWDRELDRVMLVPVTVTV